MTALFDFLDAPLPDLARYALSAWFALMALYLVWCGRQLQAEQAQADRLAPGALPARITLVQEPPPEPAEGKACEPAGIRVHLERVL